MKCKLNLLYSDIMCFYVFSYFYLCQYGFEFVLFISKSYLYLHSILLNDCIIGFVISI